MCTKPQWNSVPSFKHTISQVSGEEIRSVILIHCHLLPRAPPFGLFQWSNRQDVAQWSIRPWSNSMGKSSLLNVYKRPRSLHLDRPSENACPCCPGTLSDYIGWHRQDGICNVKAHLEYGKKIVPNAIDPGEECHSCAATSDLKEVTAMTGASAKTDCKSIHQLLRGILNIPILSVWANR